MADLLLKPGKYREVEYVCTVEAGTQLGMVGGQVIVLEPSKPPQVLTETGLVNWFDVP